MNIVVRKCDFSQDPKTSDLKGKKILFLGYSETDTRILQETGGHGAEVWHHDAEIASLAGFDAIVSFGYRHILPETVLGTSANPVINLHISYLPYNRGAHPNFWSFYDDTPAGVSIHEIDPGIDTGAIICQRRVQFSAAEKTFRETQNRLLQEVETLYCENIVALCTGDYTTKPNEGAGSFHRASDLPADFQGWDSIIQTEIARLSARAKDMTKSFVIVLANLMTKDGALLAESQHRADKAAEVFKSRDCDAIITCGWAYRPDTDLCIADAFKQFIVTRHEIDDQQVICERKSRDTVGDAVFSKSDIVNCSECKKIFVVTSDYHVDRTREIFEFVYGPGFEIEVIGAKSSSSSEVQAHEARSLHAFHQTFEGIPPGDDTAIFERLKSRHPFYNGTVHPSL